MWLQIWKSRRCRVFTWDQPVPFRNHFVMMKRGRTAVGPRSGRKGAQQSEENSCSSSAEGLRGAPGTHIGLHRLSSCWDAEVFPYGQLQHRADGKTGWARATWDNNCQATHILHRSKCFSFHTSTFYYEQKIKLCGKYIYVYIYTYTTEIAAIGLKIK